MNAFITPVLVVIFVWWLSTGAVPWSAQRSDMSGRLASLLIIAMIGCGVAGAFLASALEQPTAPYAAFISAVLVWGGLGFSLLMGRIVGPTTAAAGVEASNTERFLRAFRSICDHKIAPLAALLVLAASWLARAHILALVTFAVLWLMRISAKLCLFFGVPYIVLDMVPKHLRHITDHFGRVHRSTAFVSMLALLTLGAFCTAAAMWTGAIPKTTASLIVATLFALAVLEHWFMALPVSDSKLWRWAISTSTPSSPKLAKQHLAADAAKWQAHRDLQQETGHEF
ncbi:MAG: DUF3623 family protein [Ahrensia sp.]|nr:DUF3623 family protein [Ahrensia sp.]